MSNSMGLFYVNYKRIERLASKEFVDQINSEINKKIDNIYFGLKSVEVHEDEHYVTVIVAYEYLGVTIHKYFKPTDTISHKYITHADLDLINNAVKGAEK